MARYELTLDDLIILRDCTHYLRRGIFHTFLDEQKATKDHFSQIVDRLDGITQRVLEREREKECQPS